MTGAIQMVRDDEYEDIASSYQCLQVTILDSALQENGIVDPAVRQKICESFLFEMGNFHDQGWLKSSDDAEPVYPLLCFSKRFLNTTTKVEDLGEVLAPSEMFSFHEYAFGNAALLFEGDPSAIVETGTHSEE